MSSLGIMRGVLLGDVGEPRADALVAALEEHLLRPLDGERREAGDRVGQFLRLPEEGLPVLAEAGDEPHLQGLLGGEVPARQRQLVRPAVADDVGEPLERPEIGDDPDPRLPDREDRVPGGQPDVAGAGEIDPRADAPAVHRGDDGLPAAFDGADRLLDREDSFPQPLPVGGRAVADKGTRGDEVEPGGEHLSLRPDDDRPDLRIFIEGPKGLPELGEELVGHGIPLLRPVEDQPGHVPFLYDLEVLSHVVIPPKPQFDRRQSLSFA